MFVGEVNELPQVTTEDATPIRLGKSYFRYDAVTRIEAVVLAGDPATSDAASFHLQYSFILTNFAGVVYRLGSGIRTIETLGVGSLWDASIVTSAPEEGDPGPKFWFEITGAAATSIIWGGRARIWTLDIGA